MELKGTTGIAAAVAAVVVLVGVLFFLGKTVMGEPPNDVSADKAPAYARERGMLPASGGGTDGAGAAATGRPNIGYGQGPGYSSRRGMGPGGPGGAPVGAPAPQSP
jgi:hypothetical protein